MARKSFRPYKKEELEGIQALLRAGFSLDKVAKIFGMRSSKTLKEHAKQQPSLDKIVNHGISMAVAEVANALYTKATGCTYYEDTYEPNGADENGEPVLVLKKRVKKESPPDVFAANSFLNNRAPDLWKTKREETSDKAPKTLLISINNQPANKMLKGRELEEADYEVIDGK